MMKADTQRPTTRTRDARLEWLVAFAMTAFLSLSLAQVFVLPLGEGFDEIAHYSYVALVADEGRLPMLEQDMMDATWESCLERLPGPYATPFTQVTYREFFERPEAARREAIGAWRAKPVEAAHYALTADINWEAQHPPLYYWLMVPVYKLTAHLSMAQRVLWMRLVSVIIAATSIVFFRLAWRAAAARTQQVLALGAAVAVLTPALVLDVARLGNDSLTMALAAALFWQMLALRSSRRPWLTVVVIGVLLGLGLLTKGFFVAFVPGAVAVVAVIARHRSRRPTERRVRRAGSSSATAVLAQCAVVVVLCAAIAGWWFVRSHRLYGTWILTYDTVVYRGAPSAGLGPAAFATEFARGLALRWATYFYCGTWSLALMAVWWFVPFAVISVFIAVGFGWRFRPAFWRSGEAVLLVPFVPLLAAFTVHLLFVVRYKGAACGGGYYFHVAWPFIALLVGTALVQFRRAWQRALIGAALVGFFITYRVGDLAQLLITGGIADKAPSGFLRVPPGTGLAAVGTALHNLGELVPLAPGLAFYAVGVAAQVALLVAALRCLRRGSLSAA